MLAGTGPKNLISEGNKLHTYLNYCCKQNIGVCFLLETIIILYKFYDFESIQIINFS